MLDNNINRQKKRGRPPKYTSTEERKAAKTERRRAQRKAKAPEERETPSEQQYIGGPGQAVFVWPLLPQLVPGGPSALEREVDAAQTRSTPNESNDSDEFLPPLSPLGGPSPDPSSTRIDNALDEPIVNSEEPIATRGLGEVNYKGVSTISDAINVVYESGDYAIGAIDLDNETEEVGRLADRLVDQLVRH